MKDVHKPLDESEMDRLDRFLLGRVDEDADTEGKDEGVLDMSELDGMLTAIVSGPVSIPPSQWLPALWGDFAPAWRGNEEFENIFSMLVRHMNGIVTSLMEEPERYEPLFLEQEFEGETCAVVDEWCEGYLRGMALAAERWEAGGKDMAVLLAPIRAFTGETDWRAHDLASREETDKLRRAIAPNVREIHAYWLKRCGHTAAPAVPPAQRAGPRAGRNDPCPCGSGKKYKKCCLH